MSKKLPRGYRNNNPGNIRLSNSPWKGRLKKADNTDGAFEQFTEMKWGVRALIKLLRDTYILRRKRNTVEKIIKRYAPSFENDTTAYINVVCGHLGVEPDQKISTDKPTIKKLIEAIIKHENGYLLEIPFDEAWKLSL